MRRRCVLVVFLGFFLIAGTADSQQVATRTRAAASAGAPQAANTDPAYLQLRNIKTSGQVLEVSNAVLKRDAAVFTFKSGHFFLLSPVEGRVTGAVFIGEGGFSLVPPTEVERRNLALFARQPRIDEEFSQAIFRFTDDTADELAKLGTTPRESVVSPAIMLLDQLKHTLTNDLQYNLDLRILQDVLAPAPGGFFVAFISGKKSDSKELFVIDPHGVQDFSPRDVRVPFANWASYSGIAVAPEEVAFEVYSEREYAIWTSFHFSSEYATGQATGAQQNAVIDAQDYAIDVAIDGNGRLQGTSTLTFAARYPVRVVILQLFETLRVTNAFTPDGKLLPFIQEEIFRKNDGKSELQVGVVLPKTLSPGERYTFTIAYGGPDAVLHEGSGNYYPATRDAWYPNAAFGDYAAYDLTFRVPKGLEIIASAKLLRQTDEGHQTISQWRSEVPQIVAGFNLGRFKKEEAQLSSLSFNAEAYANVDTADLNRWRRVGGGVSMASMLSTTGMTKKALGEVQLAVPLYSDFFGPTGFKHLAVTQQTALNYGQSWPELVYLPITSFLDATARRSLGMEDFHGYFKVVGPHEIAHQWWGHTVGSNCYRDQWISEGFADFSASLFLQAFYTHGDDFRKFWEDEHYLLTRRNQLGFRGIDAGPLTLGYRLMNRKTGVDIPRLLIYPKGAFVLHMLRMMMWDMRSGDQAFKAMMQDFVRTYSGKPASTEDFKTVVERHMTPIMNAAGNARMDWFFDEWVNGTGMPKYEFKSSFGKAADGTIALNMTLTESGVNDSFMMPVPIYIELADGRLIRIGSVLMKGNSTLEKHIALNGLREQPKRALINYYHDVLSE